VKRGDIAKAIFEEIEKLGK